jgi:hypothetical protein
MRKIVVPSRYPLNMSYTGESNAAAELILVSASLVVRAYLEACTLRLSTLDALHSTIVKSNGIEQNYRSMRRIPWQKRALEIW